MFFRAVHAARPSRSDAMSGLRDAIDHTMLGWIKPELDEVLRQARSDKKH